MPPIPPSRRRPGALASLLLTALLAAPALAQTQTPTPTQTPAQAPGAARPDPLDPQARVPALRHLSSLAQFRRGGDEAPVAWREANEAVARIGGWRAYAREAQQPEAAAAEKPAAAASAPAGAPAPRPMSPAGHSGHKH